jgi:hypothetical protein
MRCLFLVTHTPNCEPFWRSLEAIGHEEVRVEQYDNRPHDRHGELIDTARTLKPDFIVYIGAYAPSHGRPVPSTATLCRLRDVAPFILLCGDAADEPWWPVLEDYHQKQCFTTMVAIDGNFNNPIDKFEEGVTLLTPVDPRPYWRKDWASRQIKLGMVGGMGHRQKLIADLQATGLLDYRLGPIGRSYWDFAQILCNTKITLNLAQTGTGKYLHVKGRIVEAGFAGSVVLEQRGSPLQNWFEPGVDYLEYETVEDILQINDGDVALGKMASRYHDKMVAEHSPKVFWKKALTKANARVEW